MRRRRSPVPAPGRGKPNARGTKSGWRQLVSIKIHGVTPEYIRALADAGYHKVAPEQLISMRIHGVTPKYVQEIVEAGYPGVPPQDLISMRIYGVDAEFIRKRTRGGARPSVQQLISDRIHGR